MTVMLHPVPSDHAPTEQMPTATRRCADCNRPTFVDADGAERCRRCGTRAMAQVVEGAPRRPRGGQPVIGGRRRNFQLGEDLDAIVAEVAAGDHNGDENDAIRQLVREGMAARRRARARHRKD